MHPHRAQATVSVKSVILLSTRNTLECSTSTLQSPLYAGTLRGMRYAQVCQPVVTGTFNTSTGLGLASFFSLQFQRGPPGTHAHATLRIVPVLCAPPPSASPPLHNVPST